MFALMLCFSMANAQVIEGKVLKSWDGASGSIEIPANVTEIADNCFYSPAEEDPDTWEVIGEEKSNTNITNIKLNNVALYIIRCKFYYGTTKRENANGAKGTTAKHIRRKNGL